ncbi:MAG: ABC transporter ATP-binding protein, partial [Tissierellia bacterium]|nr:ABC transporter ATP-binding protein [Tissierellia bacterium]
MAFPTSIYYVVANMLMPLILLIGGYFLIGGTILPGEYVAFILMSLALSTLLIAFQHTYSLLKELKLAAINLAQAYHTKPLPYTKEKVQFDDYNICFKNVSFSYDGTNSVL